MTIKPVPDPKHSDEKATIDALGTVSKSQACLGEPYMKGVDPKIKEVISFSAPETYLEPKPPWPEFKEIRAEHEVKQSWDPLEADMETTELNSSLPCVYIRTAPIDDEIRVHGFWEATTRMHARFLQSINNMPLIGTTKPETSPTRTAILSALPGQTSLGNSIQIECTTRINGFTVRYWALKIKRERIHERVYAEAMGEPSTDDKEGWLMV